MKIKYKIFFATFAVMFAVFSCFAFLIPTNSAKAVENVITTFESNRYHDLLYTYEQDDLNAFNVYRAFWYIDFVIQNGSISAFYYSLDTNYNTEYGEGQVEYTRDQLRLRPYNSGLTSEDYFVWSSRSNVLIPNKYMDYVCEYEIYSTIPSNATPTQLTISYTPLSTSNINWTAKRNNTKDNAFTLCTYTWSNEYYSISFTYVARYTIDFWQRIEDTNVYAFTMYYSQDNTGGNDYQAGYETGFQAGIKDANSKVDRTSASYAEGFSDGANGNLPFLVSLFSAIADSQLTVIEGLLGFDFLGVNMLSFFKVIITLGLVYGIFRLIKG